jgi:hypothetical protein
MSAVTSAHGTFQIWRDVRVESVVRAPKRTSAQRADQGNARSRDLLCVGNVDRLVKTGVSLRRCDYSLSSRK